MKVARYLYLLMVSALFVLTSCTVEDLIGIGLSKGKYEEVEPCLQWGAGPDVVNKHMLSMKGWKVNDSADSQENEIDFINISNNIEASYEFDNGKLIDCFIEYVGCNNKFDNMKYDIETKYNVVLEKDTDYDIDYDDEVRYFGYCPSHHCEITIGKGKYIIEYMYVDYEYVERN